MRSLRLAPLLFPLGLLALLAPERAAAQLCDRAGYTREASCPNEARDATGCCPAPPRRAPPAPSVTAPPADEACPMTQVRSASGRCCWPGQRGTSSGCAGRPRSCPLGWEANASGCLPAGTRARAMVLIPPVNAEGTAFVIDRTPVTVQAYRACVDAGACEWREPEHLCNGAQHRTHPMNCVSPAGAAAYCAWAGLRLPTDAEWERAAGGADGRRYPWGDALPDDRRAHWGRLCARPPCTAPVGRRPQGASPYGVLDLAGNVWEQTAGGQARGGNWSGSERDLRIEANARPREPAQVGFRCAGDLVWDYVEALGESESPVAQRALVAAFVELALARRDLGVGVYGQAAARFEAASAALAEAGHSRAFVFRYYAAAARARAGDTDAAVAHLAAYFEAGGADSPRFDDAPPIPRETRLAGWEQTQPRWAQREGFRDTLGAPPRSMSRQAFEGVLWDLVEATMESAFGRHLEAAAKYHAAAVRLRQADHPGAGRLWAYSAASLEAADEPTHARRRYAIYLDSGGEDPPTLEGLTLSEALRRDARALSNRWQERFQAGRRAFRTRAYAEARRAFEQSYTDVEGHPRRAQAKVWLARTHELEGDLTSARARYVAAARLAPAGDRAGDYARARLERVYAPIDQLYQGRITENHPRLAERNRPYDVYEFVADVGWTVEIDMMSSELDAYLYLEGPGGEHVARNDDGGDGLNARIRYRTTVAGRYRVLATTFSARHRGAYTLRLVARP